MIRCAVFDFDGTLILSNQIKTDALYVAAAEYRGAADHLREILADPHIGDRYAIFGALADRLAASGDSNTSTEALALHLVERYGALCTDGVATCPEVPGASQALTDLKNQGLRLYVSSLTPDAPLRDALERRDLMKHFDGVYGSSSSKKENLKSIRCIEDVSWDSVVMIGDADTDCHAARQVGCYFIGVAVGEGNFSQRPLMTVPDLTSLADCVRSLSSMDAERPRVLQPGYPGWDYGRIP